MTARRSCKRPNRWIHCWPASLALAALALAIPPAQAGAPAAADPADSLVMARVNGEPITLSDLRAAFGARHEGHGGLLVGEQIIRTVVGKAVDETMIIQEGRRMGIPEEPEFRQAVEIYADTLRLTALEERRIRKAAEPAAAQIQEAYARLPRQLRVAVIETRSEAKAGELRLRLRAGEEFGSLARQSSVHRSRTRGGDLGWLSWGALDAASESAVFGTPVGQVSEPFKVGEAWRIVKVLEEKRGEPPAYEMVAGRISAILAQRGQEAARGALLASVRAASPPRENRPAIERLIASELAAPRADRAAPADPADDVVLMTTATGLEVTAGRVRERARRSDLSLAAAWDDAAGDALLIDEARRRVKPDSAMRAQIDQFVRSRIRARVEQDAILRTLTMDDAAAKAFYQRAPQAFAGPASYRMRHIVSATRPEAEEISRRLAAGDDFAALARERSIDRQTSASGGEMGWVTGPAGEAAGVFALAEGATSDVVRTTLGYSVVQVLEIKRSDPPAFEQVRHDVAQRLLIEKQHALREAFLDRLRKISKVSVDEAAILRAVRIQERLAGRKLDPAASRTAGGR